ncbi:hypothetical protein [Campylobacter concisus]|uniref:hypothetical protein n=2 Tax=Campylobacter concisus TaxID=199 RepID=UPI00122C9B4B|nr:hypothetical protein [Campylobacter concisus]
MKELEKTVFWAGINWCRVLHGKNSYNKDTLINDRDRKGLSYKTDQGEMKRAFEEYIVSLLEYEKIKAEVIRNNHFNSDNQYDIFISHSHADIGLAKKLRDVLWDKFNFTGFIDSELWANINILERHITREYSCCITRDFYRAFDIILSTSLNQALLNSKFFIFIKTDNSIKLDRMDSPWLYFENQIAKNIFYKKPKGSLNLESINESQALIKLITVDYKPDSDIFDEISGINDLVKYFKELGY